MNNINEVDYILQKDWQNYLINDLGNEPWVVVYRSIIDAHKSRTIFYSGLIPKAKAKEVLSRSSWEISIGDGKPSTGTYYHNGKGRDYYERFPYGYEPLVIKRTFNDLKEPYWEVLEEFRLFHNLYFERANEQYIKINDNGEEDVVIKIEKDIISIRQKEINEFLLIRKMQLAIFFDIIRYSVLNINELPEGPKEYSENNLCFSFSISDQFLMTKQFKCLSRTVGKKLLIPQKPRLQKNQYAEFIIGQNKKWEPIHFTCNPQKLANFFGSNEGAPNFLTPCFFKREVLSKYYSQPEKYEISDNYLRCGSLWSLHIDNNHPSYIIVFLGYLGQGLSYTEQLYWKSYNVTPDGKISSTTFRRSFLAEFAEPEKEDLILKSAIEIFQKKWFEKNKWNFFKPLKQEDKHHYITLRIPLSNDQAEFDAQVGSLTKVLIDSINETQLLKELGEVPPDCKGISKLQIFLNKEKFPNCENHITFLRDLQELRSGVAHRKGQKYRKAAQKFGIGNKDLINVFEGILQKAIDFLHELMEHLLTREVDNSSDAKHT